MWGKFVAIGAVAVACLSAAPAHAQDAVYDPFEGVNRDLYKAHDAIDNAVLEPLARGYRYITPEPVREGVTNVLRNLRSPVIFVNDVLQAEPSRAGATAARFGINTTIGILGIFDPATGMGLERHDEDFGQTLAVWGVDEGPYFFVPLLGPTNLRDGTGRVIDIAFDPLTWARFDGDDAARATRTVTTGLSSREAVIEEIDSIRENSLDPYVTFRTSYQLWREAAVRNGRSDVQDLPEFEAIPEEALLDQTAPAPDAAAPDANAPQGAGEPHAESGVTSTPDAAAPSLPVQGEAS